MRHASVRRAQVSVFSLCALCALCGESSSAPPTVTYLYPAGAQRGTTAEVTAAGTFDPWPAKVWVSGKGVSAVAAKEKGKFAVTVAADAEPGIYWLRAYNDEGASIVRPFVVGMIPEVAEKEPNDEPRKPQVLDGPSVTVNGRLEKAGDVDCFAVMLQKGQTVVASLEAHEHLRSPMDGVLQILTPDGTVRAENNDYHGLDPQLAFTAPAAGTYVVRVFAFPATPDASIRFAGADTYVYRLTVTTEGFADYALPLAVQRTEPGSARLVGWNIPDAKWPVRLPLPAEGAESIPVLRDGLAHPPRVLVEPHPTYDATVPPDTGTRPKPFEPPASVSIQITERGKPARIPFMLKKGRAVEVQVRSESLGLALVPVVRVLGPGDTLFTRAEPTKLHTDVTLTYPPTADVPVTIEVSDLYGGAGPRHAGLLRVVPVEPDYDLSVTSARAVVVAGGETKVPVKITRKHGFTKPVEVVAEGLPAGVKGEVVEPAKPDPNTVTLALTAPAPVSGAFRLVGKVKDEPGLTRVAKAPLPEFDATIADLWVTVTPSPSPKK